MRIVPLLKRDFHTQVCVHLFEKPVVPAGQRLPLFVLVTRQNRLIMVEGMPDYPDLKALIEEFRSLSGESEPPK